jgi:hypothetical protein
LLFTQVYIHLSTKISGVGSPVFDVLTLRPISPLFSVQIFKDDLRLGLLTLHFSMDAGQAGFLYMPLMHSEDPEHHVKVVGA